MVVCKCPICGREFNKAEHVKRHERTHTKERPYECNICHKRFSRSDVLGRHAKSHKGHGSDGTVEKASAKRRLSSPAEQTQNGHSQFDSTPNANFAPVDDFPIDPSLMDPLMQPTPVSSHGVHVLENEMSSNPLNYLADISAQHAHAEVIVDPRLMADQQNYFGWEASSIHPTDQYHAARMTEDSVPGEDFLESRGDSSSNHRSVDFTRETTARGTREEPVIDPNLSHSLQ